MIVEYMQHMISEQSPEMLQRLSGNSVWFVAQPVKDKSYCYRI